MSQTTISAILAAVGIKATPARAETLRSVLDTIETPFSSRAMAREIMARTGISKSTVIASLQLFRGRGLLQDVADAAMGTKRKTGRPETYLYATQTLRDLRNAPGDA